jgi:O-antigen/teichoic acid export membrane protein
VMIPRFGVGGAAGATVAATVTRTALAGALVLRWRR